MKCEFCGGTLSLEEEYCPHCGQANKHAKQHIKDMRHYQGKFENTEKYVRNKATTYSEVSVRAIIIAVLTVLTIVMLVMAASAWDIQRGYKRSLADKKYNQYSAELNRLIEEKDYLALSSFADAKMLDRYDGAYEVYRNDFEACDSYVQIYESVQRFISLNETGKSMDYICEMFGSSMDLFYRKYEDRENRYTEQIYQPDTYLKMMDSMMEEINLMLKTYCGFTEDELEQLPNVSNVRKQVLFEEKLMQKLEGVAAE